MVSALTERLIVAAERKSPQEVFDVGAEVYDVCTSCHAKYAADIARPSAQD